MSQCNTAHASGKIFFSVSVRAALSVAGFVYFVVICLFVVFFLCNELHPLIPTASDDFRTGSSSFDLHPVV